MRKLALASVCLLASARAVSAAPGPTQGVLYVATDKLGEDGRRPELVLEHTDVRGSVVGFVQRVEVEQTFANPYPEPLEAVYVFPLPHDGAVGRMEIRVGDRTIKSTIQTRAAARKLYEDAKHSGKTAALLEQERENIFTQSVANILPGERVRVLIVYDAPVAFEKGVYEIAFPMVVGPRYIPADVADAAKITPPVVPEGQRTGADISLAFTLSPGLGPTGIVSPSHEIGVRELPASHGARGATEVKLSSRDNIPNKDFVLRYRLAGKEVATALLAERDGDGGTFTLMFQPPASAASAEIAPRELTFVVDTSGSMQGVPLDIVKRAMRHALTHLHPSDTFKIIRFSDTAKAFAKKPLPSTPDNVRNAIAFIDGLEGEGGTEMIEGIRAALSEGNHEGRLRVVCFMTDGYVGNDREILTAVSEGLGDDTRLFSFGIGSSVNRSLLDGMAEMGRGAVSYVLMNQPHEPQIDAFYQRIANPVLTHVTIDWGTLDARELSPARVPDLFVGQPLTVIGRYAGATDTVVKVRGKLAGKPVAYDVPLALSSARAAGPTGQLAKLWARGRIHDIEMEAMRGAESEAEQRITALALRHELVTAYTSFVAIEERVVTDGGETRTVAVPVEMPAGVSYSGIYGGGDEGGMAGGTYDMAEPSAVEADIVVSSPAGGGSGWRIALGVRGGALKLGDSKTSLSEGVSVGLGKRLLGRLSVGGELELTRAGGEADYTALTSLLRTSWVLTPSLRFGLGLGAAFAGDDPGFAFSAGLDVLFGQRFAYGLTLRVGGAAFQDAPDPKSFAMGLTFEF